jgi:CRP-like cAMP-binding protein
MKAVFNASQLQNVEVVDFKKGDIILREGEKAKKIMYYLIEGNLVVSKNRNEKDVIINEIKKGQFFGECSFISDAPRLATITVETDHARIAKLTPHHFKSAQNIDPKFFYNILSEMIEKLIRARKKLARLSKSIEDFDIHHVYMDIACTVCPDINEYIKGVSFFFHKKGDVLYKQGEVPRKEIFFVEFGELTLTYKLDGRTARIGVLTNGGFFGEDSIVSEDYKYFPSVTVSKDAKLVSITKDKFIKLIKLRPDFLYHMLSHIVKKLDAFEKTISEVTNTYGVLH